MHDTIEYFSHLMLLLFMHPFINSNAQSWLRTFPNIAFQLMLFLSSLWSFETSVGLSLGRAIRHYMTSTNNLIRMSLSETCENPFFLYFFSSRQSVLQSTFLYEEFITFCVLSLKSMLKIIIGLFSWFWAMKIFNFIL